MRLLSYSSRRFFPMQRRNERDAEERKQSGRWGKGGRRRGDRWLLGRAHLPSFPSKYRYCRPTCLFFTTWSYDYYRSGARWPRNAAAVTLQFRWRISRRDGSMVTDMPLREFVDGPLKYLGVFIGFLGTIHGYVSFWEVSAFISADVADVFKMKYC